MIETPEDRSYLVEIESGVLRLSFNRPEAGNAVPIASVPSLIRVFQEANAHPLIRAVLVRGEGKIFSGGGNIAGFARSLEQDRATRQADFAERLPQLRRLSEAVIGLDMPLIVAVRGAVAGWGLLYPLAADLVLGEPDATLFFAHQRMGLSPDGAVTALLPQAVGAKAAKRLLLTGAKVEASEGLRLGLIDEIVETGTLEDQSMTLAVRLAQAPQLAIRTAKRLIGQSVGGASLSEQLDNETSGIVACVGDDDFAEGVRAFLEKRPAAFPSTR